MNQKYVMAGTWKNLKESGITLVALVITIIILIILAGVAISLVIGDNGIAAKARMGAKNYQEKSAKERLEIIIDDYHVQTYTGANLNFKDFVLANGADNVEEEGNNYIVDIGGFSFTLNKNLSIIDMQEAVARPQVSNITLGANGSSEIADHSVAPGQGITINFDASIDGGEVTEVVPALPYTTNGTETSVTFTINGTVNGKPTKKLVTVDLSDKYRVDIAVNLSKETLTNEPITASVNWGGISDTFTKEISINNGASYEVYTGDKVIDKNCTIIARASSGSTVYTSEPKVVDFIDRLEPNAFNVGISDTISSTTLRITASTTDREDSTGANKTSGIAGYIYYVYEGTTEVVKSNLITDEQYDAEGLTVGTTYTIYAEAYDLAGNMVRSTNTETCTKIGIYTWEKYTANPGSSYEYYKTGTMTKTYTPGSKCLMETSLDKNYDTQQGKWERGYQDWVQNLKVGYRVTMTANGDTPGGGFQYYEPYVWLITSGSEYTWTGDTYASRTVPYVKGSFIENVSSTNENAYPANGAQEENGTMYYFVKQ